MEPRPSVHAIVGQAQRLPIDKQCRRWIPALDPKTQAVLRGFSRVVSGAGATVDQQSRFEFGKRKSIRDDGVTLVQDFVAFTIGQNAPIPGSPFDFRMLWPNSPTTDQALIGFTLLPTPSDRIPGTPQPRCDVARRFRHSTPGRRTASAPAAEHCSWPAAPFG